MLRSTPASAAGDITSVYSTHLCTVSLTWTRDALGLSLLADLSLPPRLPEAGGDASDHLRIRLRPCLPWRRKGSKRRSFTTSSGRRRAVELAWNLCDAAFSGAGGAEPAAGLFVAVAVDGEIALVAGDRSEQIARRERVRFGGIGGEVSYATRARFGGRETAVWISIDVEEEAMRVGIDGERVLEVEKLRWKFRGSEVVAAKGCDRIRMSWDLHEWFFWRECGGQRSPAAGEAVFVFRFEKGGGGEGSESSGGLWSEAEEEEEEASAEGSSGEVEFTLIVCGRKKSE